MMRCLTSYIIREMQQWVWQYTCYSCLVTQLCPTLCHPVDHSPPGSSIHGISQERTLEWAVISFFRGSSQPKDQTCISCIGRQVLYHRTSREAKIFTIWSSRKNFCWSLFCSIIVVIVKVLDSSTHIFLWRYGERLLGIVCSVFSWVSLVSGLWSLLQFCKL